MRWNRTNPWALTALVDRDERTKSELSRDLMIAPSTLTGVLSGRRDASEVLLGALAVELDVPVEALSTDPFGYVAALAQVARASERLATHLGDGADLRAALTELRKVMR